MGTSIGLLELKSIPIGVQAADEMLKAANVELLMATPICPGKYVIVIGGNVGAVKSSLAVGLRIADTFLVGHHIINNVHESIPAALCGTTVVDEIKSLGIVETMSALTAIRAGDIAAKAANIQLMEIRVARGLGGKGFLIFTGEISTVRAAVKSCLNDLQDTGDITSSCVIASPHPGLLDKLG